MAKKKAKKSKQVEWASPPPSPKPTSEDPVPALPDVLPSLSEPESTDSTSDDAAQPIVAPAKLELDDPLVEAPQPPPTSEEPAAADPEPVQDEQAALSNEEHREPAPTAEPSTELESEPVTEAPQPSQDDPVDVADQPREAPAPEPVVEEEVTPEAPKEPESTVESEGKQYDTWGESSWEVPAPTTKKKKGKKGKKASEVEEAPKEVLPAVEEAPKEPEPIAEPEEKKSDDTWGESSWEALAPTTKKKKGKKGKKEPKIEEAPAPPAPEPVPESEPEAAPEVVEIPAAPEPPSEPIEVVEESVPVPEPEPVEVIEEPVLAPEPTPEPALEPAPEPMREVEEPTPEIVPEPVREVEEPTSEILPEPVQEVEQSTPEVLPEPAPEVEEPAAAPEPQPEPAEPESLIAIPEPEPEPLVEAAEPPVPPEVEPVALAPEPVLELASPLVEPIVPPSSEPTPRPESPATIRAPSPAHSEIHFHPIVPEESPKHTSEIYAPSPARTQSHPALKAREEPLAPTPPAVERPPILGYRERPSSTTSRPKSPPKPPAVAQIVDDRPPAPTPPVGRLRQRHAPAFDSDDDDDLALIQPRLRGDPSRGATYPPQSSHPRSLFASRVPQEHYSPPPPPPPPGYHHRYYPPAAPPYHHNHAYSMSQNGYPNPGPYGPPPPPSHGPSSHGSSPYQESWSQFPPTYPPYGNGPRHDSVGSREYALGPPSIDNSLAIEDDSGDVFSRIAQAIPDLHVLLAKYKETHGQLGVREELLRRAAVEQEEKLRNKDEEIYHLKEKMSNMERKHSGDASRLRLEIGNMEEQMKELREQIAETEKFKKEAEEIRIVLDAAKTSWEAKCKELEDINARLERTTIEDRERAQKEFDSWRTTANTRHDAEKIALAIQFDKKLKEADVVADKQRQEAAANFVKEKDELRSEHQRQQRERESNYDRVRKELETKLSTAQKDREEALIHERESREVWEAERETLAKAHAEDRDSLQRGWKEQRELLEGQYVKNKEESDKAWIELHAEANKKAEEEKSRADRLTQEKEELLRNYNELKAESQREKEVIKSVAGNLENEKARLEKLMECYGDIAEIKSKGDTYYSVSFSQLQRQILDLATTHFIHLPVSPPPEDLASIPSGLPSFLGDTTASRQLRAAYVAHTVAKMITYRVFGPFLFSLGRRYDKADSLFSSMSNHIRDKSTRKEAIWRQQTLLAAFTSSGAKQRINTAAGTVVDEIIVAIKNFADPKEEEGIRIAVKRIVKLAAETWRFARLEREMITATMPALQDEDHKFTGIEYWAPYRPEGTPIASLAGTTAPSDERPKLLLRLFPVIYREPKHENFRTAEDEKEDSGCIYHHGLALYDDAEPVVTRGEELRNAGLPPVANSSPTAADFPPPIIPPPRNPPPPTPAASDKASVKSSTTPPPVTTPSESSRSLKFNPSELSIPPYRPRSDKASVRTASPPPPSAAPAASAAPSEPARSIKINPSELSIPPFRARSDKASVKSTASPPHSPKATAAPEPPGSPALTMFELASRSYSRPLPAPYDINNSGDAPPPPEPTESSNASPPASGEVNTTDGSPSSAPVAPAAPAAPAETARDPPATVPTESADTTPPANTATESPLPAPTGSTTAPSQPSVRPRPPIPTSTLSLVPTESAIIPPALSRRTSTTASSTKTANNDPQSESRAATPPSPLFAAIDEIEALYSHRSLSRNPSNATSRRSTPSRTSNEELRKDKERGETLRRTSGYTISNRSSMEGSQRTERTSMSNGSRYMCESRSAAIKGLYPNSPMAGTPTVSRTNSLRRSAPGTGVGTWDTNSASMQGSNEGNGLSSTAS